MCVFKNHHFSYVIIQIPWIFWNYLNFYLQHCISFSAPYRVSYYWLHILKLDTFENKETTLSYHSKCSARCFESDCDKSGFLHSSPRSRYRVFHLVFTYFKWLCLCNLWYFNLCCKDQNWFEEWQFCLTKIGNFGDFDVWKIDCQNMPLFPNLLSWSSGKSQGWYAKGPWFKTWLWQV